MELTSLSFIMFFTIIFGLYWWLPSKLQPWILALSSLVFYFSWKPAFGWVLFLTTGLTYVSAVMMMRQPARKKRILTLTTVAVLTLLFVFKYLGFFGMTLNSFGVNLGIDWLAPHLRLALPLGISFYTFQVIGYLVDVYRGKTAAEHNFIQYLLFVLYFPKIIAGPIERSTTLLPQLHKLKSFSTHRTVSGLRLFIWGVFKKVVIADNLKLVIDPVFENLPEYRGLSLVLIIFFYSWQIYADFSGYTDMARGLSRLFGIELLENFKQPYLATSVGDFWRRWHISLSSWLREYLYFPLGGSRGNLLRTIGNIMVVFILCGLWHGAAWSFVVWGGFHGAVLAFERIASGLNKERIKIPAFVGILYTYTMVCISWVFFRAATLDDALYILRNSLVGISNVVNLGYVQATVSQLFSTNVVEMGIALFCIICIILMDQFEYRPQARQILGAQPAVVRYSLYISAVLVILVLRNVDFSPFVYVQF